MVAAYPPLVRTTFASAIVLLALFCTIIGKVFVVGLPMVSFASVALAGASEYGVAGQLSIKFVLARTSEYESHSRVSVFSELAPVESFKIVLGIGVLFESVPIVFAPVRVNAIFGNGVGQSVYESDQSRISGVVVVELLVNSADRVSVG